jgi:hypothetical protein
VARKRHYSVLGRSLSENDVKETPRRAVAKIAKWPRKRRRATAFMESQYRSISLRFFVNAQSNAIGCTPRDPFFFSVMSGLLKVAG